MGDVLVYLEPDYGTQSSHRLLVLARSLAEATGGALVALVAHARPGMAEDVAAADVVLEVVHPALDPYVPEAHQAVLVDAIRQRRPHVVLVANTTAGTDVGAAAAVATGIPYVGYCVSVAVDENEARCVSELYGGSALATVQTLLPAVIAVNASALTECPAQRVAQQWIDMPAPAVLEQLKSSCSGVELQNGDVDITQAERVVAVGRGIGGADGIAEASALATALNAELAASRPVVDAGWLRRERQVGKSGRIVKPELYLALGISGAPEHIEGMREAALIVAVNNDPAAPIFSVAHYGAVADLFDVCRELTALLAIGDG